VSSREELIVLFEKYGAVSDLALPLKCEGDNKGYAFVTFVDPSAVMRVFEDSKHIHLRAKPLDIKYVKAECGPSHVRDSHSCVFSELGESVFTGFPKLHESRPSNLSYISTGTDSSPQLLNYSDAGSRKKVLSNPEIP
jgi:RNA recognition motif-containing protein